MDLKGTISEYWDWRSESYTNGFNGFDDREKSVWKSELQMAISGKGYLNVLDIGTGPGFMALIFAEMGHTVTGVDISTGMLEKARENARSMNLNVEFRLADAEELPFDDESFDLIVNRHLLWTLPHPDLALAEWVRVLKPEGRILAIDGSWFDPALKSRIRRGLSKAITLFSERRIPSFYSVFDEYYNPIRSELPLYRDANPSRICDLFREVGLSNVATNYLQNVWQYHRGHAPLTFNIAHEKPTFLVKGEKI